MLAPPDDKVLKPQNPVFCLRCHKDITHDVKWAMLDGNLECRGWHCCDCSGWTEANQTWCEVFVAPGYEELHAPDSDDPAWVHWSS